MSFTDFFKSFDILVYRVVPVLIFLVYVAMSALNEPTNPAKTAVN